ncbi:MAG: PLP-dependent cysteine synthase family protein, partial [Mycobacteriales bacterium]
GLGLALAGQVYGHPVTLVTDPGMEPLIRHLLAAYGARVELVSEPAAQGGWQQARLDRVAALQAAFTGSWTPNQYDNPDNVAAYAALADELVAGLDRVDVLVAAVGTGGHSNGVARALRRVFPALRLVGVDAVGSVIFGQPAAPRLMRGLGSSVHPVNVDKGAFDQVHWVNAAEAVWSARALARSQYTTGGWSVGAVALVARWVARTSNPDTQIVAIFPDGPHRYGQTVFNDEYCDQHDLLDHQPPSEPALTDDPTQPVSTWTRCRSAALMATGGVR